MVEVGYGRGRVGSELSHWARDGLFTLVIVSIVLSEGRDFPKHDV